MRDLAGKRQELKRQLRKLETTLAKMETSIILRGRQVILPVEINWRGRKRTLNLLLDTGASMTVLHQDSVASLNTVSRDSSYAQVAGGGLIKTERVVFDRVSVGPYDFENQSTAVIENSGSAGFNGLLGMDILGRVRYEIDYGQRKIVWSPGEYKQMQLAAEKLKELQVEAAKITLPDE
ncbi:MAG: clan AA aspartic protease [Amphritea sp.]|nr:clan AA aspartic protease [Amphritea sp.]